MKKCKATRYDKHEFRKIYIKIGKAKQGSPPKKKVTKSAK